MSIKNRIILSGVIFAVYLNSGIRIGPCGLLRRKPAHTHTGKLAQLARMGTGASQTVRELGLPAYLAVPAGRPSH